MKRILAPASILLSALVFIVAFQNCANDFKFNASELADKMYRQGEVICDPFSQGAACEMGKGLKGNLYYLAANDSSSPRSVVGDIISNGVKAPTPIVFSQFDVGQRSWEEGFPMGDGIMHNTDGQPLVEWFAFDLEGMIGLPKDMQPGDYQFAIYSDDGAILKIDGATVIDHDGQHAPSWKCASQKVSLQRATMLPASLKYFQGPRNKIALRVMWRPWSLKDQACDDANGGFVPVSKNAFYH